MEIEIANGEARSSRGVRTKSSQRLRYESETAVLKKKIGGLEEIRHRLGLSQRKISQLLLVDPSAWTRWTRSGDDAPPIIYRALSWYLAVNDKYPALDVGFWLRATAPSAPTEGALLITAELSDQLKALTHKVAKLEAEKTSRWRVIAVVAVLSAFFGYALAHVFRL